MVGGRRSAVGGESDSSGKIIPFRDFCKFCEDIITQFNLSDGARQYYHEHSLRLYNAVKFIVKVTGGKKGLTLLSLGSGIAKGFKAILRLGRL